MEPDLPSPLSTRAADATHRVSTSLRYRQIIFVVISVVLLGFVGYDVYRGDLSFMYTLVAIVVGIIIGYFVGRIGAVRWHEEKGQIVSQLDIVGVAAIIIYIAFDLSRDWIFAHFFSGLALSTFTLAVLAGALIGRFFGVQRSIMRVLRKGPPAKDIPTTPA